MTPHIKPIIAIALLSASFCAGWLANGWRYDEKIATIRQEQAQAQVSDLIAAGVKEAELTKNVEDARNDAVKREAQLRADYDRARDQSERMRGDIAEIRRNLPELTREAVNAYADAASVVFDQCQRRYTEVAKVADQCNSDLRTLSDAWPK